MPSTIRTDTTGTSLNGRRIRSDNHEALVSWRLISTAPVAGENATVRTGPGVWKAEGLERARRVGFGMSMNQGAPALPTLLRRSE